MVLDLSSKAEPAPLQNAKQELTENVLDLCVKKKSDEPTHPYESASMDNNNSFKCSPSHQSPCSPRSEVYENNNYPNSMMDLMSNTKPTRPFKAFPKDPSQIAIALPVSNPLFLSSTNTDDYIEFRHKMLSQVQPNHNGTNKNMRRNSQNSNSHNSDPTYWEKRKKNNEAAKRSRDARRAKEDEIAVRCAYLERENLNLKFKLASVESERQRLHSILYNS